MIADLLIDLVLIERSVIIWFSPVQGLHTRLGVLQVCEVLVLQDWVLIFHLVALMVTMQITSLDHEVHLVALTVKKQITSLDHEGCKMEGRAPH